MDRLGAGPWAGALLIHLAIAFVVLRPPAANDPPPLPSAEADLEVDVVPDPAPPVPAMEPVPAPAPAATAEDSPRPAPRSDERLAVLEPRAEEGATTGPPAESRSEPPSPAAPLPQVTRPETVELGLWAGGRNPFLPRSEAAVEAAEVKRNVDRAMKDPARERERELGLGPEGPVLTALAEGTMQSLAPVKGRAVFLATANAAGEVVSIELHDSVGERAGWADAGRIALEALQKKKLRVPPGTTRSVMRIEVVSEWKLPSGRDPGVELSVMHIPIAKGEGPKSTKIGFLEPTINVHHLEIAPGVKIPIVTFSLNILHGNFDPVDIGASARRIIHTRPLQTTSM